MGDTGAKHPPAEFVLDAGRTDLVLYRVFDLPVERVWAALTDSEHLAQWFCTWRPVPGSTDRIVYRMTGEDDTGETEASIVACRAPEHLAVRLGEAGDAWDLDLHLTRRPDGVALRFAHHLEAGDDVGAIGPGWEYYLDRLCAALTAAPMPDWDDYYPILVERFAALAPDAPAPGTAPTDAASSDPTPEA